ncbi:MAG: NUDIX domain-containing protein [Roseiflexus sp.]|nr:NUDIX domain-containing protein [Roseiflexus sp.]MCS7288360.1 NUDIX domain-containing protein [Roseiflexus sp.]MDW8146510.1 NUDIX domain-containing protein [Roseiflexaceae bacterium]MDW8231211.1 NUDIX domain-containing protein [Roseiflexaceae bacterium]
MHQQIVNGALALIYRAAHALRGMLWHIARPSLLGVRALVVRDDQVLLVRHRGGATPWGLPGGAINPYERLEEAARREVYEESGVPAEFQRVLGVYDAFHFNYVNYIIVFVFTAQGEPGASSSIEIAEARFFPLSDLPDGIDPGSRRRIDEYLAGATGISALW